MAEWTNKTNERREAGLCIRNGCPRKPKEGYVTCESHLLAEWVHAEANRRQLGGKGSANRGTPAVALLLRKSEEWVREDRKRLYEQIWAEVEEGKHGQGRAIERARGKMHGGIPTVYDLHTPQQGEVRGNENWKEQPLPANPEERKLARQAFVRKVCEATWPAPFFSVEQIEIGGDFLIRDLEDNTIAIVDAKGRNGITNTQWRRMLKGHREYVGFEYWLVHEKWARRVTPKTRWKIGTRVIIDPKPVVTEPQQPQQEVIAA